MSDYILELRRLSKSFAHVKVLDEVSLNFRRGEVHALMGENGAGKSTLMKIIMGIYAPDAGEVVLDGRATGIRNPRDAMACGISMIHQELNPIRDMDVAENLFIGRELVKFACGGLSVVDLPGQRRAAATLFNELGVAINPKALMRSLSVAQTQLVEIVKAISLSSKVIIMDEPTSAITANEVEVLFAQIDRLRKNNVTIIYISHKMDEIFRIADRISVLRDGSCVGTYAASEIGSEGLIKLMVGREIKDYIPKAAAQIGGVVLEVEHLCCGKKFSDVSFSLHAGEILGISGLVGAGRSELAECIFGIRRPTAGEIRINGRRLRLRSPREAIGKRLAMVTEDRKYTGLNLKASVQDNITMVGLPELCRLGVVNKAREQKVADKFIEQLKIKTSSRSAMVSSLSGGNQQKVVIAKWLQTAPEIIIMDEPTRGVDVAAKRDIYILIGELAKAGKAVLLISSELPEIMGLSDRILVLAAGRLTGEIDRPRFSQELIMRYASDFGSGVAA